MLDGWRALSILLVLAGHLFPLAIPHVKLNAAVAAMGMVLFFILSGFLITRFLATPGADVRVFVIRRFFRIVPLAWIAMAIALWMEGSSSPAQWVANYLFYANLPPFYLTTAGSHLWSLCVEVQFYAAIALLVALGGQRGLYLVPVAALTVTGLRIATHTYMSIVTWVRIDEILAGATLALLYDQRFGAWPMRLLGKLNVYLLFPVLLLACHPLGGPLNYLRPYIAAAMVGSTLVRAPRLLGRVFEHRWTGYVATISYAVYIFHGLLSHSWVGTGDVMHKYLKRPLLLALTFGLAHISTFWFEQPCIAFAKRLTDRFKVRVPA